MTYKSFTSTWKLKQFTEKNKNTFCKIIQYDITMFGVISIERVYSYNCKQFDIVQRNK